MIPTMTHLLREKAMSRKPDRGLRVGQGTAVASLAAVVACALASDALASSSATEARAGERDLSTRVATLVERIRLGDPTVLRDLPLEKIAQWRNY
jgi:hypothetical protein